MHLFISKSNCWHTVFFLAFLCLEISPEEKKKTQKTNNTPLKNQKQQQQNNRRKTPTLKLRTVK